MADWTDQPSSKVVSRLTSVPLEMRDAIKAGPSDRGTHDRYFDSLPFFREIEIGRAAARHAAVAGAARVMFWNVERFRHFDAIARTIERMKPDVMLLCEIDRGMARSGNGDPVVRLSERLDAGYAYAVEFLELDLGDPNEKIVHTGETNAEGLHGAAIVSDVALATPFLIRIDRRGDWFDGTRDEPRVGGTIAIGAKINVGGLPVLTVNAHLESHDDPAARAGDMRRLLAQIDAISNGGPVVLGGDFNTSTSARSERLAHPDGWRAALAAEPMRLLRPQSFEPLFEIAASFGYDSDHCNVPDVPTMRYRADDARPRAKLDWFFTRRLVASNPQIIPALRDDGEPSSDHDALLVTVAPA